ncbi:MAG: SEC-C domain-containing protein, partial [Firmicutes bacterium]|nr:SEC-C domain-containing protein [Bacillota bacterium]
GQDHMLDSGVVTDLEVMDNALRLCKLPHSFRQLGGLHIIGTERHEARRIDNQLRGRSGRQGDPGSSQFFVALDDDLMRLFGGEKIQMLMSRLNVEEDSPLESGMLTKTIENAQKKVEGRNYGIRRYVLQYDDVMNRQRSTIYAERRRVLDGEDLREHVLTMMRDIADEIGASKVASESMGEEMNVLERVRFFCPQFKGSIESADDIYDGFTAAYKAKEAEIGEDLMREIERMLLLRIVDTKWMDHIDAMEDLKTGIGLQSIGQKDPAREYANVGGDMFEMMVKSICEDMVRFIFNVSVNTNTERKNVVKTQDSSKEQVQSALDEDKRPKEVKVGGHTTVTRKQPKVGRNDPCPCGSGKKYKNCCGKNA